MDEGVLAVIIVPTALFLVLLHRCGYSYITAASAK